MGAIYNQLLERLDRVITERDEARKELEQWKWDYNRLSKLCSDKVEHVAKDHDKARAEFNRLTKERDNALAEVEQLKQALHDARLENSGQAALLEQARHHIPDATKMIRPEPSRLEIAAQLMAANLSRDTNKWDTQIEVIFAIEQADALIAAAKEGK